MRPWTRDLEQGCLKDLRERNLEDLKKGTLRVSGSGVREPGVRTPRVSGPGVGDLE